MLIFFSSVTAPSNDDPNSSENPIPYVPFKWPVVPSFQDWQFPTVLPPGWISTTCPEMAGRMAPQSLISPAVRARDRTCRISFHETGTDVAHLCPVHEQAWFISNQMVTWNTDLSLDEKHQMHDASNLLLLRADLHLAFDERKFCFFPKGDSKYVVHMLAPTPDIGTLYHNSSLHPIDECSPEMLYTRFAWAIFPGSDDSLGFCS